MGRKSEKIAAMIRKFQGQDLDAHYLGYFECFNHQLFYEAHDVLEQIWLAQRKGPNDLFYKGLIQLSGAFVHLQKGRLRPAAALFKLAQNNLRHYPAIHQRLPIVDVSALIKKWLQHLELNDFTINPFLSAAPPQLHLI